MGLLQCSLCNHQVEAESILQEHMEIRHLSALKITWPCGKCSFTSHAKNYLKHHVRKCHEKAPPKPHNHQCPFCYYGTKKNRAALLDHLRDCHPGDLVQKPVLEGEVNRRFRDEAMKCSWCSYKVIFPIKLSHHLRVYHQDQANQHAAPSNGGRGQPPTIQGGAGSVSIEGRSVEAGHGRESAPSIGDNHHPVLNNGGSGRPSVVIQRGAGRMVIRDRDQEVGPEDDASSLGADSVALLREEGLSGDGTGSATADDDEVD
ncbi:Uu.00g084210.m01.CDS01 [Anthostomella pinea]|uniref:Uu.00g084210.m01.CDS01 n=1 Tax=Anthostomella pinea TaxID=933095 RepID=A0AAI8VLP7_9PEZI|nr:Uu.00g084210.m01.CDS01 [Anthostomella pinea]